MSISAVRFASNYSCCAPATCTSATCAPAALRFGGNSEPTPARKKRKFDVFEKIGITLAALGAVLSLGLGAKANVDYNGKFDVIPRAAQETQNIKNAGIPGILVLAVGSGFAAFGRDRRKEAAAAKKADKTST